MLTPHSIASRWFRRKAASEGLVVDLSHGLSIRKFLDPSGQIYDTIILLQNKTPAKTYRAVIDAARRYRQELERMRNLSEALTFINQKLGELKLPFPTWHRYSMPD